MDKELKVHKDSQLFVLPGLRIQSCIYERVRKYREEQIQCLKSVAKTLADKIEVIGDEVTSEDVAHRAAGLMMSLEYHNLFGTHLKGEAMVTKSWLERASWLNHEILELSIIRENLVPNDFYEITMGDAKRYGIV